VQTMFFKNLIFLLKYNFFTYFGTDFKIIFKNKKILFSYISIKKNFKNQVHHSRTLPMDGWIREETKS